MFEESPHMVLERFVDTNNKWLYSPGCTSWSVYQCCFTFLEPLLHIRFLLSSTYICMWNFTWGSRSWRIVENIIPILVNSLLHNCFVTPCFWVKHDLNCLIPLLLLFSSYSKFFPTKDKKRWQCNSHSKNG